jgi:glycosyltransferase involved in cell wall biosynthesis
VVIVQEAILQYRGRFFELLRPRLADRGIDLTLVHSNPEPHDDVWKDSIDLPWSNRVAPRRLPIAGRELIWQRSGDLIRGSDLVIVEQATRHVMTYLLTMQQAIGYRRVALWGHGRNFNRAQASRPGEWAKARMSTVAHWWFAYTDLSAEVVAALGYPPERITVVQNAIDTHELAEAVAAISPQAAARSRDQLGLGGKHVGVFVGKLSDEKRLDYVFTAADVVRQRTGDFELLVAGAGVHEPMVRSLAEARPWARYLGPRFGLDKAELLRIADVLMIPSWAGLVVLDSFATGVPLIASADLPHPPETSYIEDGVNGRLVADGADPRVYGAAIADLLEDRERYDALVRGCHEARRHYTIEAMVDRFATGIEQALTAAPNHRRVRRRDRPPRPTLSDQAGR